MQVPVVLYVCELIWHILFRFVSLPFVLSFGYWPILMVEIWVVFVYIHINYLPSWHSRFFDHVCQNFSHFLDIVQYPSTWRIQVLIRSDNQFLGGLLWNCHSNAYSCQMGLRYSDTVIQLARQSQLVLDRPSRYRRGVSMHSTAVYCVHIKVQVEGNHQSL